MTDSTNATNQKKIKKPSRIPKRGDHDAKQDQPTITIKKTHLFKYI